MWEFYMVLVEGERGTIKTDNVHRTNEKAGEENNKYSFFIGLIQS